MPLSKSRNVSTYVRAELKRRTLDAKLVAAEREVHKRAAKLTGGQRSEADRLLAMDPALLATMAKPCAKVECAK